MKTYSQAVVIYATAYVRAASEEDAALIIQNGMLDSLEVDGHHIDGSAYVDLPVNTFTLSPAMTISHTLGDVEGME